MSEKISSQMASFSQELEKLRDIEFSLIKEKKKRLIGGDNVANLNQKLERVRNRARDIETLVLPDLQKELERVRELETEEERQRRIKEIIAENRINLAQVNPTRKQLIEYCTKIEESATKLDAIRTKHQELLRELKSLGGQMPSELLSLAWTPKLRVSYSLLSECQGTIREQRRFDK